MPKRKRSGKEAAEAKHAEYRAKLYSVLWNVKGHLRQWQSKQLRGADKEGGKKAQPTKNASNTKKARLEKEVLVLKALDLHHASNVHLASSLLRISAIAESPDLPEELKKGIQKPEVSEDEKAALHNVISALYNRAEVRKVIQQATEAICEALEVPVPQRKSKDKKKSKGTAERKPKDASQSDEEPQLTQKLAKAKDSHSREPPGRAQNVEGRTDEDLDDQEQELAVSRFEEMLGSSSGDEESDSDSDDGGEDSDGPIAEKDPMEISSAEEEEDGYDEIELEDDDENSEGDDETSEEESDQLGQEDEDSDAESSDSEAIDRSPPHKKVAAASKGKKSKPLESVFLPSLMGGYISGSESASDVDVAPASRKNRRGQKARQAIWEKKYREEARHLKSGSTTWDPKRGAVSSDQSKPWKKGARNPSTARRPERQEVRPGPRPQKAPVDSGPLHPSWEARRKAKEAQNAAKFEGTKVKFD